MLFCQEYFLFLKTMIPCIFMGSVENINQVTVNTASHILNGINDIPNEYLRSKRKHCKISGNSMISLWNSAAISQGIGPGTGAAGTITAGGEDSKGFSFCIGSFGKYRVRFLGISLLFKICKGWSKRFGIGLRICWKGQCHSKNCCRCDCK